MRIETVKKSSDEFFELSSDAELLNIEVRFREDLQA